MAGKTRKLKSMDDLYGAIPDIFEKINQDPELTLLFAANPLFLVEELGYQLSDEVRHFAARRLRFSAEPFERLIELEQQIWEQAGERFEINSGEALAEVLFEKHQLPPPRRERSAQKKKKSQVADSKKAPEPRTAVEAARPLPARVLGHGFVQDPLDYLRGEHPVVEPLLEYRQLDASRPRLAPRRVYQTIKEGEVDLPVSNLKFRFKGFKDQG